MLDAYSFTLEEIISESEILNLDVAGSEWELRECLSHLLKAIIATNKNTIKVASFNKVEEKNEFSGKEEGKLNNEENVSMCVHVPCYYRVCHYRPHGER